MENLLFIVRLKDNQHIYRHYVCMIDDQDSVATQGAIYFLTSVFSTHENLTVNYSGPMSESLLILNNVLLKAETYT